MDAMAGILQGEYGITRSQSEKPILVTPCVGSTVVFTLWSKEKGLAVLAHLDESCDTRIVDKMIWEFKKIHDVKRSEIKAQLIGGWKNIIESFELALTVKKMLTQLKISTTYRLFEKTYKGAMDATELISKGETVVADHFFSSISIDSRDGHFVTQVKGKTSPEIFGDVNKIQQRVSRTMQNNQIHMPFRAVDYIPVSYLANLGNLKNSFILKLT